MSTSEKILKRKMNKKIKCRKEALEKNKLRLKGEIIVDYFAPIVRYFINIICYFAEMNGEKKEQVSVAEKRPMSEETSVKSKNLYLLIITTWLSL